MKNEFYKRWWFWLIISIALLLNIGLAVKYENDFPNVFTAISGWISAIATIILGCIAVWQNKRYKELSDEMTDLMLMPDFYPPTAEAEKTLICGNDSYNQFIFELEENKPFKEINKQGFALVRPPIVNLIISEISCCGVAFTYKHKKEYSLYLPTTIGFFIGFQLPSEYLDHDNDYQIVFEYENSIGNKYIKTGTFHIDANTTSISNFRLYKARRIQNG